MRIHILSDIHLEFGDFEPALVDADAVILAGDIGVGLEGVQWANRQFPGVPKVYVAGNHEFYGQDIGSLERLKSEAGSDVHVLENDTVILGGTRFLGCTLWTDFAVHGIEKQRGFTVYANREMNDYRQIWNGSRKLWAKETLAIHAGSRAWLEARLAEPFDGRTVVVTHHAPTPESNRSDYRGYSLLPSYVSDLEHLMSGPTAPSLWVHGHLHVGFDDVVGETRVVCNARGYAGYDTNPDFVPDLVIELEAMGQGDDRPEA